MTRPDVQSIKNDTDNTYKVVILGSGPSSAYISWQCSLNGLRSLVIDKHDLIPKGMETGVLESGWLLVEAWLRSKKWSYIRSAFVVCGEKYHMMREGGFLTTQTPRLVPISDRTGVVSALSYAIYKCAGRLLFGKSGGGSFNLLSPKSTALLAPLIGKYIHGARLWGSWIEDVISFNSTRALLHIYDSAARVEKSGIGSLALPYVDIIGYRRLRESGVKKSNTKFYGNLQFFKSWFQHKLLGSRELVQTQPAPVAVHQLRLRDREGGTEIDIKAEYIVDTCGLRDLYSRPCTEKSDSIVASAIETSLPVQVAGNQHIDVLLRLPDRMYLTKEDSIIVAGEMVDIESSRCDTALTDNDVLNIRHLLSSHLEIPMLSSLISYSKKRIRRYPISRSIFRRGGYVEPYRVSLLDDNVIETLDGGHWLYSRYVANDVMKIIYRQNGKHFVPKYRNWDCTNPTFLYRKYLSEHKEDDANNVRSSSFAFIKKILPIKQREMPVVAKNNEELLNFCGSLSMMYKLPYSKAVKMAEAYGYRAWDILSAAVRRKGAMDRIHAHSYYLNCELDHVLNNESCIRLVDLITCRLPGLRNDEYALDDLIHELGQAMGSRRGWDRARIDHEIRVAAQELVCSTLVPSRKLQAIAYHY